MINMELSLRLFYFRKELRSTLKLRQFQLQEHTKNVNDMKNSIADTTSKALILSAKLQQREQLEHEKKGLESVNMTYQQEMSG